VRSLLRRLFLLGISIVACLLILISLLVLCSLGFIGSSLLSIECLPSFTKDLANLAKGDTWVLVTDILTLLVGEEHVGGKTTLWRVGVLLLLLGAGLGGSLGGLLLRHDDGFGWV